MFLSLSGAKNSTLVFDPAAPDRVSRNSIFQRPVAWSGEVDKNAHELQQALCQVGPIRTEFNIGLICLL
jgi:hypothetical protein